MVRRTGAAAKHLGVPISRLHGLIRHRRMVPPPSKDSADDYVWTDADLARARAAMRVDRRRKTQLA